MQVLKSETRERVMAAAEAIFAESGFRGATMAAIAERAGISTGNVYRYFASKEELFETLFPESFADELMRLLRKRVGSLTRTADLLELDAEARGDAEALLRFWVEHRRKVVVLLDRAEGSARADVRGRFVEALVRPTSDSLRERAGGRRLAKVERLLLRQLFDNTVRTLVAILDESSDDAEIRNAFEGFWSYQLAGLAGFSRWVKP